MKRYGIIAAIAAAALLLGCSRSEMPGKDNSAAVSSEPMKAYASFADGTKSHFGKDGYKLVWDSTDKIYAYSSCIGTWAGFEEKTLEMLEAMNIAPEDATPKDMEDASIYAYFRLLERSRTQGWNRSGVFNIDPTGSGKESAVFESVVPASSLFGVPENPTGEEIFLFYAFYPAPAEIPAVNSYNFLDQAEQLVRETPFPYVYVEVPAVQDGIHYQDYQLLMNGDAPASMEEALKRTDDQLYFKNFFPLTSILEFTLGTTDNIQASIARLEVSVETQEEAGGPYRGGKYLLGGKVPCFFSWDEPGELRLWNRYCAPILSGFSKNYPSETIPNPLDWDYDAARWDGAADASPVVTIQFDNPVEISQTQTTQKYYAVVIPSRCVNNSNGNPHIVFNAYNAAGDKILTKTITASSPRGIDEGIKYSFDLTLDTYYDENVLSGLFSVDEGKQIYIARGNLQALWNGSSVERWKIAQHQYDFVGESSVDLSTYTGWFDLFGFSSTANNFGISNSTADADYVGDPLGWTGAYPVARGNGWRTITADEGVYLFTGRSNAMSLFAFATILVGTAETPVKGLVFLPDQWTLPAGCTFSPVSSSSYDFAINKYNADGASSAGSGDWEAMEAAGAVFWPMAGRRSGTNVNLDLGAYWSGSPDDDRANEACMLEFTDLAGGHFSPDHFYRYYGACVRLIKDLN
ncbi:MAG: hypothetical protein IKP46_05980 [Bacteroidales bacterium]|nr:hypothetical protein [Bacteroidales bacterium]